MFVRSATGTVSRPVTNIYFYTFALRVAAIGQRMHRRAGERAVAGKASANKRYNESTKT